MELTNLESNVIIWAVINIVAAVLIVWLIVRFVKRKRLN